MATIKQQLLRFLYPLIRKAGKLGKNGHVFTNKSNVAPPVPFYDLTVDLSSGEQLHFSQFKGKKVLLVNTASDCGYTGQYAELQSLHEKLGEQLIIMAFPSNDFAEQEKGSDSDIVRFCQVNYGVTFPLAKKGIVTKHPTQHPVFRWLSDSRLNGWNDHGPDWNFSKYIIDEHGYLTHYFGPSVSPLEKQFLDAVNSSDIPLGHR